MKMTRIPEAEGANPDGILAMPLLEGTNRTCGLSVSHLVGRSRLTGTVCRTSCSLWWPAMASSSNLGVAYHSRPGHLPATQGTRNCASGIFGTVDLTMLAFLAPKFAAS